MRVAVYVRVSSWHQVHLQTIDQQLDRLHTYIRAQGRDLANDGRCLPKRVGAHSVECRLSTLRCDNRRDFARVGNRRGSNPRISQALRTSARTGITCSSCLWVTSPDCLSYPTLLY